MESEVIRVIRVSTIRDVDLCPALFCSESLTIPGDPQGFPEGAVIYHSRKGLSNAPRLTKIKSVPIQGGLCLQFNYVASRHHCNVFNLLHLIKLWNNLITLYTIILL